MYKNSKVSFDIKYIVFLLYSVEILLHSNIYLCI